MPKQLISKNQSSNFTPAAQRKTSNSHGRAIQPKLTVGQPNDKYEQEADNVADQVMRMPSPEIVQRSCIPCMEEESSLQTKPLAASITPIVQRQPIEEEEEELMPKPLLQRQPEEEEEDMQPKLLLQRQPLEEEEEIMPKPLFQRQPLEEEEEMMQPKPLLQRQPIEEEEEEMQPKRLQRQSGTGPSKASTDMESRINQSRESGWPLPSGTRSFMENRFGTDFGSVRVHSDSTAMQMNKEVSSQAFTVGNNIYFNSGRYSPESSSGKQLLAHELTHVVQQSGDNRNTPTVQRRVQVTTGMGQILHHFHQLCRGSWSSTGQFITGHANDAVNIHSSTCLEDTVNDPDRIYSIQVDPVGPYHEEEDLYDGTRENLLKLTVGPHTEPGPSPVVHMPPSGSTINFGAFNPSGNAIPAGNWRILAHELCGHARLNQGYTGPKGDRPEHNSTINTENQIAAEHGDPARGMYNDRRQGESYHCETGNPDPRLVFKLVDGWHYETSAHVQNPPITTGPIQGTVTASELLIRQGPSTSTPMVGSYPRGTVITLLCQTPGTAVDGNSLWDRTNLGYVSDRYVSRPPRTTPPSTTRTKLPTCDPMPTPATGVIYGRISTATSRLRIRQAPSTSSPVLGSYRKGEMVSILCQTTGTEVLGSSIWDQTDRGYISDRYVERLPPNATVPPCLP